MRLAPIPFRFDAAVHQYVDLTTGAVLPSITQMLERAGVIDSTWFTEESSVRGTAVHALTADFDLGALDVATCVSPHRAYLLGHVKAIGILQPEIFAVEEAAVHPWYKFGGRPDRRVRVGGRYGVLEIKSGEPAKSHMIQTALQCILVNDVADLPAELLLRLCLYLKPSGKFAVVEHTRKQDFAEARRIVKEYAQ